MDRQRELILDLPGSIALALEAAAWIGDNTTEADRIGTIKHITAIVDVCRAAAEYLDDHLGDEMRRAAQTPSA